MGFRISPPPRIRAALWASRPGDTPRLGWRAQSRDRAGQAWGTHGGSVRSVRRGGALCPTPRSVGAPWGPEHSGTEPTASPVVPAPGTQAALASIKDGIQPDGVLSRDHRNA